MADKHDDDYHRFIERKHFLSEVEQGIRLANREIIHKRISPVTRERVLTLAVAVARLRAAYLEAAFQLGGEGQGKGKAPGKAEIAELEDRRTAFEEARHAYEALREAIEKGYVELDGADED